MQSSLERQGSWGWGKGLLGKDSRVQGTLGPPECNPRHQEGLLDPQQWRADIFNSLSVILITRALLGGQGQGG